MVFFWNTANGQTQYTVLRNRFLISRLLSSICLLILFLFHPTSKQLPKFKTQISSMNKILFNTVIQLCTILTAFSGKKGEGLLCLGAQQQFRCNGAFNNKKYLISTTVTYKRCLHFLLKNVEVFLHLQISVINFSIKES